MIKNKKPVVLMFGDSPCAHTGFGNVMREIGIRLKNKYDLVFLGINDNGDPLPEKRIFHIYPCNGDPYGRDRFPNLLQGVQPDLLFTLNDYDALTWIPQSLAQVRQQLNKNIPWIHHFPVDGEPFYSKYTNFIKEWVDFPVSTTKWGSEVIRKTDPGMDVPVIYHGVDKKLFAPMDREVIKAEREKSGFKDKFVILMVGVNQIRKQYGTAIQAFAEFAKDKDDVVMLLHTQKYLQQGWDLPAVIRHVSSQNEEKGLNTISDKIAFTNSLSGYLGVPRQQMPLMYNFADVFLHTANGEGFGLPLLEAASCGVPIIAQKATVMPEILGAKGALWCKTVDKMFFPFADRGLERPLISKKDIVKNLNILYQDREKGCQIGDAARKRVVREAKFDWDVIADEYDELFQEALQDKKEAKLDVQEVL